MGKTYTYTFDVKLFTTLRVQAPDEQTARDMIAALDGNAANFGAWPDGEPIVSSIGLDGEHDLIETDEDEEEQDADEEVR